MSTLVSNSVSPFSSKAAIDGEKLLAVHAQVKLNGTGDYPPAHTAYWSQEAFEKKHSWEDATAFCVYTDRDGNYQVGTGTIVHTAAPENRKNLGTRVARHIIGQPSYYARVSVQYALEHNITSLQTAQDFASNMQLEHVTAAIEKRHADGYDLDVSPQEAVKVLKNDSTAAFNLTYDPLAKNQPVKFVKAPH